MNYDQQIEEFNYQCEYTYDSNQLLESYTCTPSQSLYDTIQLTLIFIGFIAIINIGRFVINLLNKK